MRHIEYTWVVARLDGGMKGPIVSYHSTRDEAEAVAARLGAGHEVWPRPAGTAWQGRS